MVSCKVINIFCIGGECVHHDEVGINCALASYRVQLHRRGGILLLLPSIRRAWESRQTNKKPPRKEAPTVKGGHVMRVLASRDAHYIAHSQFLSLATRSHKDVQYN